MNILILDAAAERYRELLSGLPDDLTFATSTRDAPQECPVLLAQPDLAAAYLKAGGRPSWIQSTWAGVTPIIEVLNGPLQSHKVQLTGVKGIFGPQISEYAMTYILQELRTPATLLEAQRGKKWEPVLPQTAHNRHMVIAGTGSIGAHLASIAGAFGMRVTGVSRSGNPVAGFKTVVPVKQLRQAVAAADYVVAVLPDTPDTRGLFDEQVFSAMRNAPMFINVGRGSTVDESALLRAVREGQLRQAVLDVFAREPLPPGSPLWSEPGVIVTPHVAAASFPSDISRIFLENMEKFRAGQRLSYIIDPALGY